MLERSRAYLIYLSLLKNNNQQLTNKLLNKLTVTVATRSMHECLDKSKDKARSLLLNTPESSKEKAGFFKSDINS